MSHTEPAPKVFFEMNELDGLLFGEKADPDEVAPDRPKRAVTRHRDLWLGVSGVVTPEAVNILQTLRKRLHRRAPHLGVGIFQASDKRCDGRFTPGFPY